MQQQLLIDDPSTNTSPHSLAPLGNLSIQENQPVGTFVGEFNATDTDANSSLTFHLVPGDGSSDNGLFTLGVQRQFAISGGFRFREQFLHFLIRVQAMDEFNASIEGNFTVILLNQNEAPVLADAPGPLTLSLSEDDSVSYDLNATDVEGDGFDLEPFGERIQRECIDRCFDWGPHLLRKHRLFRDRRGDCASERWQPDRHPDR